MQYCCHGHGIFTAGKPRLSSLPPTENFALEASVQVFFSLMSELSESPVSACESVDTSLISSHCCCFCYMYNKQWNKLFCFTKCSV